MTSKEIIDAFDRIERERGGYRNVDAKEVLRAVADDLGLTYERVRDVMLEDWGGMTG